MVVGFVEAWLRKPTIKAIHPLHKVEAISHFHHPMENDRLSHQSTTTTCKILQTIKWVNPVNQDNQDNPIKSDNPISQVGSSS